MDYTIRYCPTRRRLEDQMHASTDELFRVTSLLLSFVGKDHRAFVSVQGDCTNAKIDLTESRQKLQDHLLDHGC